MNKAHVKKKIEDTLWISDCYNQGDPACKLFGNAPMRAVTFYTLTDSLSEHRKVLGYYVERSQVLHALNSEIQKRSWVMETISEVMERTPPPSATLSKVDRFANIVQEVVLRCGFSFDSGLPSWFFDVFKLCYGDV